jgi:hypothetical protein
MRGFMARRIKTKQLFLVVIIIITLASSSSSYAQKINMTYLYAGNTSLYSNNVDRSNENISIVCPDYFEIFDNGDLKLLTKIDKAFVDAMHENIKYYSEMEEIVFGRTTL